MWDVSYNGIRLSNKKDVILPQAATWMDLQHIMPSEISQMEKDTYHTILLYVESKKLINKKLETNKKNKQKPSNMYYA